jgi:FkbM family methyltransferase
MLSRLRVLLRPRTRWRRSRELIAALGWRDAAKYQLRFLRAIPGSIFLIHPRASIHPLFVRGGTSDLQVLDQIFVQCEYASLDDLPKVGLVIDCGANVGYSTAYFLSRHPDCRVLAVEPDPENFLMLERNLHPYGSRVQLLQAGVWSHKTRLALATSIYRDGSDWAKQVRLAGQDDDTSIAGIDIGSLLASSGQDRS